MLVYTEQMVRDHLFFKGPMSLGEIVSILKVNQDERSNILVMLNALQDRGQAVHDVTNGVWRSLVTLS